MGDVSTGQGEPRDGARATDEAPPDGWTVALPVDDLWEGEMIGVRVGDVDVLLVNLGAQGIHAFDNRCPHAQSRLSEGHLRAGTLQCAAHLWEFDVRTGLGVNPRNCHLRRYAVKVADGLVLLQTPPARAPTPGPPRDESSGPA